jgi:hypothetical protein
LPLIAEFGQVGTVAPVTPTYARALPPVTFPVVVLLAAGPLVTTWALLALNDAHHLAAPSLATWLLGAAVLWLPHPLSLTAVLTDAHRDAVLPGWTGLARIPRAVLLLPAMLSPGHPAAVATAANVASLAASALWLGHLGLLPL